MLDGHNYSVWLDGHNYSVWIVKLFNYIEIATVAPMVMFEAMASVHVGAKIVP